MRAPTLHKQQVINNAAKNRTPRLVPTNHGASFRDNGWYDSSEGLPDLDLLLGQTLRQIEHTHTSRERHPRSFDTLWNKVCKRLEKQGNATAYAHWKTSEDVVKNRSDIRALDAQWAAAWMSDVVTLGEGDEARVVYRNADDFDAIQAKRVALKPKIKVTTDDTLEIAIAYWIEAKNARDAGDDLRVLHALVRCHLYVGMTLSAKTESESKSDAGKRQGKVARDAMATTVLDVLRNLDIDKKMKDPDYLWGQVAEVIAKDPRYASTLKAYEAQVTTAKKVVNSTTDRLADTAQKWATKSKTPYPDIAAQYRCITAQIEQQARLKAKKVKRQAHG
ncbi:hypothetical protein [Dyella japonica]|uniref:Uncharacterized protein n=1 Tax=Dyella japonica TaxID=231455 RepID=A0ABV2JW99_9GAMM